MSIPFVTRQYLLEKSSNNQLQQEAKLCAVSILDLLYNQNANLTALMSKNSKVKPELVYTEYFRSLHLLAS